MKKQRDILNTHPCFSQGACNRYGRIHLPVAPACNIQCRYCVRDYDCVNESRPGVTSRILDVDQSVELVRYAVGRDHRMRVVGIAGPGDPLANPSTLKVFERIHGEFPDLTLCLSTNGLLLAERLEDLVRAGVSSVTVTINSVDPVTAEQIYSWVVYRGRKYEGKEAASLLLCNQWKGLQSAVETGFLVKLNYVLIPGINCDEAEDAARIAATMGVDIMNILPMIPQGEFAGMERPSVRDLNRTRDGCGGYIDQMRHCKQCRADALGILGDDRDADSEVLMGRIGDEYTECVL